MINSKNIDKLFEDSLGDLQYEPSSESWGNIDNKLSGAVSVQEFDNLVEENLSDIKLEPSTHSWKDISSKLNAAESAILIRNRNLSYWITLVSSVAAVLFYMFIQIYPDLNIKDNNSILISENPYNYEQQFNIIDERTENSKLYNYEKAKNLIAFNNNTEINSNSFSKKIVSDKNNSTDEGSPIIEDIINNEYSDSKKQNSSINQNIINDVEAQMAITTPNDYFDKQQIVFHSPKIWNSTLTKNKSLIDSTVGTLLPLKPFPKSLDAATSLSMDIFTGVEFIYSNMPDIYSESNTVSIQKTSKYIPEYTMGINMKYQYNNFLVLSGLTYSSFGEQNEYTIQNTLADTSRSYYSYNINSYYTYDTIGWIDDPLQGGIVVPQLQATLHTDTLSSTWNRVDSTYIVLEKGASKNRYRYIEIPLMIGYEHQVKYFSFMVAAGASYGFKVAEKGVFIEEDKINSIINFNTPYSNSHINGILSFGLSYHISNNISLILQPTYKTNISKLLNNDSKYHSMSVRCGINIKL